MTLNLNHTVYLHSMELLVKVFFRNLKLYVFIPSGSEQKQGCKSQKGIHSTQNISKSIIWNKNIFSPNIPKKEQLQLAITFSLFFHSVNKGIPEYT